MALVGGGGSVRSREGKQRSEGEGGPESEGEVRGGRGLRGVAGGTREGGGSQARRRWPPRPRACEHAAAPTGKRRTTGGGCSGGGLGRLGRLVAPGRLRVSGPGRFSALFYFFLLFCFI